MTTGAFGVHGLVLSDLVDWLVGPAFLLAYLPPTCTQKSGWCRSLALAGCCRLLRLLLAPPLLTPPQILLLLIRILEVPFSCQLVIFSSDTSFLKKEASSRYPPCRPVPVKGPWTCVIA